MPSSFARATPSTLAMPLSTVISKSGGPCAARAAQVDDLRRQSIAVFEAIGNQVIDVRAHRTQSQQADRARGGAIAVVIGNDQQP